MNDTPGYRPLYRQVYDILVRKIAEGAWKPGEMLPSEQTLAREMGVSHGTVRKVLDALTAENLLLRRQGKGTFVAEHDQDRALFRFFHIARPGGERLVPQSAKVKIRTRPCRAIEAGKLALRNKDMVFEITRLRLIGGKPAIRETIILPERLFPRLDRIGDLPNTLYSLYQSQFGITVAAAREELRAALATQDDQSSMGLKAGTPILVIGRVALSLTGQPVEWRESRVRTDQLVYAVTLQ
ncbi:MAG: GntR family transcriptional regulator [Alphaproteobacteria bacterium]|nr:GntR family transcriptional regulator [Alphaproteobacteria bacterium]